MKNHVKIHLYSSYFLDAFTFFFRALPASGQGTLVTKHQRHHQETDLREAPRKTGIEPQGSPAHGNPTRWPLSYKRPSLFSAVISWWRVEAFFVELPLAIPVWLVLYIQFGTFSQNIWVFFFFFQCSFVKENHLPRRTVSRKHLVILKRTHRKKKTFRNIKTGWKVLILQIS